MEEENQNIGSSGSGSERSNKSLKDTFKSGSPDDVRDRVKDVVEKGVAAVAGALRGFNKETERSDVAGQAKGAIHQAAETTKTTVSSVTEEAKGLKEPLREAGQKLGETARELRSTARDELDKTRSAVQGAGSSSSGSSSGSSSLGSSSLGSSSSSSMGMGGSELSRGTTTGQGSEMPDLRNTPLAKPDKDLQGRDLSPAEDES